MAKQPLAEVFGFPIDNQSADANQHRQQHLCPFQEPGAPCTKTRASDPLGVCSILDASDVVITCPTRFREQGIIEQDAARFFFPEGARWRKQTEVRLHGLDGKSVGNIDVVLCSLDEHDRIRDFGALEVQAVYVSGNVSDPFVHYMKDPAQRAHMDWSKQPKYPRPDYLSSSRKRLAPQLIAKGGILKAWNKRMAVAIHRGFFEKLPTLSEVDREQADIAWLVYDLVKDPAKNVYALRLWKTLYTLFSESLEKITRFEPGDIRHFVDGLQKKLTLRPAERRPVNATTRRGGA